MGLRLVRRLGDRFRIHALTHSPDRVATLRAAGAMPLVADLDDRRTLHRLGGLAPTVVHLAPPPAQGGGDARMRALLPVLHGVERLVYVSTTGVYGDCAGRWIDETELVVPTTDRARRRVDAEQVLRRWARRQGTRVSILRVPGIYAADRLPVERIAKGTPVLRADDDVYTNHVHADDLAAVIEAALVRGSAQRVYHAVDDSAMRMGDWFDLVADAHGLARPPRMARDAIAERVAPNLLSFMAESRRLANRRMKGELGVHLRHPTVVEGLAAART